MHNNVRPSFENFLCADHELDIVLGTQAQTLRLTSLKVNTEIGRKYSEERGNLYGA